MLFRVLFIEFGVILYVVAEQDARNSSMFSNSLDEIADLDETALIALNVTFTSTAGSTVPCNYSEWHCADGGCIPGENKCNGLIECKDGSDEYLRTCQSGPPRPMVGLILYCSSTSWTASYEHLCPNICLYQPEFCYYALIAANGNPNTCRFPDYPPGGMYTVHILSKQSNPAESGRVDFWLRYSCEHSYVLVEAGGRPECIGGRWRNIERFPYCSAKRVIECQSKLHNLKRLINAAIKPKIEFYSGFEELEDDFNKMPSIAPNVTLTSTAVSTVACNYSEWQCANGGCIPGENKCNGLIECNDGSDEYLRTCRSGPSRSIMGLILHCSSTSWTASHYYLCPHICLYQPEFCYYALIAENGNPNMCRFPDYPPGGVYTVHILTKQANPATAGRVDFWLHYSCEDSYVLMEVDRRPECIDGAWRNNDRLPYCSEACRLNKNDNFTYICLMDAYNKKKCDNLVTVGTTVRVSQANLGENDLLTEPVYVDIVCYANRTFSLSAECKEEVHKQQQELENLTSPKMTEYEKQFNQFATDYVSNSFHQLVAEFREFKLKVQRDIYLMHKNAEKCNISLALVSHHLHISQN